MASFRSGWRRLLAAAVVLVLSPMAAVAVAAVPAAAEDSPNLECHQESLYTKRCRIDQPPVTAPVTGYGRLLFQAGDEVSVHADGCVQTGGSGRTWKRYVDPSGPNSDELYHGLIGIRAIHAGQPDPLPMRRFEGFDNGFLFVQRPSYLQLGYEDDEYDDNGYHDHDDGTEDQCKLGGAREGGNAFVEITIYQRDTDEDGLSDWAELNGMFREDGTIDRFLPDHGADACRKSVAVEVDWLTDGTTSDEPPQAALDEAVAMYDQAPVPANRTTCPWPALPRKGNGVQVLVDRSEAIRVTAADRLKPLNQTDSAIGRKPFEKYREEHFAPHRRGVFHYNLWGHRHDDTDSAGVALTANRGQDFLVTAGLIPDASVRLKAAAFAHELGHTLGLDHGGGDPVNFKPNYLSIMNYAYSYTGVPDWNLWRAKLVQPGTIPSLALLDSVSHLRFSGEQLPVLDRDHLDETRGVGQSPTGPALTVFWTDPTMAVQVGDSRGPLDWNWNTKGLTATDTDTAAPVNGRTEACVRHKTPGDTTPLRTTPDPDDVTHEERGWGDVIWAGVDGICDTTADPADAQAAPVGYNFPRNLGYAFTGGQCRYDTERSDGICGYNDWAHLTFTGGINGNLPGVGGPAGDVVEPTRAQIEAVRQGTLDALIRATGSDLSVRLDAPAGPLAAGTSFAVAAHVANAGPQDAIDVSLELALPAGVRLAGGDQRCQANATGARCAIGALAKTGATDLALTVAIAPSYVYPQATRPLPITATVGLTGADPQPGDNTATRTVTAESVADVAVAVTLPATAQIPVGATRPVVLDTTVTDGGPSGPVDVAYSFREQHDAGVTVAGLPAGATIPVDLGQRAQLGSPLQVTCLRPGLQRITVTATVATPASRDPDPTGNTATGSVTVDCLVSVLALSTGRGLGLETVDVGALGQWTFTGGGLHSNGGVLVQPLSTLTLGGGATLTTSTRPVLCVWPASDCPPPGTVRDPIPAVPDPLATVPEPAPGMPTRVFPICLPGLTCGPIEPGRYIGTITLGGTVKLRPGTYVFEGGLLSIGGTLALADDAPPGSGVTLVFRRGAALDIRLGGGLRLRPPATGPYAGIAVMYTRDNTAALGWRGSHNQITTTGPVPTVYAPAATLVFAPDARYDTPVRFISSTVTNQTTTIKFAQ